MCKDLLFASIGGQLVVYGCSRLMPALINWGCLKKGANDSRVDPPIKEFFRPGRDRLHAVVAGLRPKNALLSPRAVSGRDRSSQSV